MENINNYFEILEIKDELLTLNESDFSSFISKLTPEVKLNSLTKKMSSVVDKRKPFETIKKLKPILSFLPTVKIETVDKYFSSKISQYKSFKKLSETILKNSLPEISDKSNNIASSFLALSSFIVQKGEESIEPRENLKTRIKQFVIKTRKFMEEQSSEEKIKSGRFQKEDIPDLAVAWVIIVMAITFAAGIGMGSYVLLSALAGLIAIHSTAVIVSISIVTIIVLVIGDIYGR